MDVCRFAPSTTGRAHPGTLLAGLLAWLDARSRGARLVLRLEDLDPDRCRPEYRDGLVEDLAWLGLTFDDTIDQHTSGAAHAAALDRLEAQGLLYPCACTRTEIAASGRRAPDGGFSYTNRCRSRRLPAGGWRATSEPVRVRLPDGVVSIGDESGLDLSQDPAAAFGDPVVRRRDGAVAYALAVVVDDADLGVTRVVRGRDLATSTATQVALQRLLTLPTPVYRHHLLLLEERGGKLAKLHGSVGAPALRAVQTAADVTGALALAAGLRETPAAVTPGELLRTFSWARASDRDRVVRFDGERLVVGP